MSQRRYIVENGGWAPRIHDPNGAIASTLTAARPPSIHCAARNLHADLQFLHTKRCMQPAQRNARWSRDVSRHCILKQSAQTAVLGMTHSLDCHHVTRQKPSAVTESSSWTPLIPQPLRDPQPRHSTFDNRNPPPRCISHSLIPFPFRFYGIQFYLFIYLYIK